MNKDLLQNTEFRKLVVVLVLLIVLFWPALEGMYTKWMEDSNNSHGLLVPLIVVYLIYEKIGNDKKRFQEVIQTQSSLTYVGLIGMLGAIGLYFLSDLTDIVVFKNLSFVLCLQGALWYVFGLTSIIYFLFPIVFTFFMIPVPTTVYGMVALPMQLFATKVSVWVLQFTPLAVSAEGNIIRVGNEMLTVAEACSGLRSLMAFIMIALLFAYLAKTSYLKKAFLVSLSIPIAIIGNIIRIVFTTFVAWLYGSEIAAGFIHDVSGYVMFVIAFGVFFLLAKKLEGVKAGKKEVFE